MSKSRNSRHRSGGKKAQQGFGIGVGTIVMLFIGGSFVMSFLGDLSNGGSRGVGSAAARAVPTAPDPEYVWGLPNAEEAIVLDTDTVIEDNIAIVLDFSGSMTEEGCEGGGLKAWVAVQALDRFLAGVPQNVNLALIAFDESGVNLVVPMGSDNAQQVREAVATLSPGGGTPLGEAMDVAVDTLERAAAARLGYGSYKIVVITDGVANDEKEVLYEIAWANLNTPIITYTAGFCIGTGHPLNQPGETVYASANDTSGLLGVLEAAVAEAQDFVDGEGGFDPVAGTSN